MPFPLLRRRLREATAETALPQLQRGAKRNVREDDDDDDDYNESDVQERDFSQDERDQAAKSGAAMKDGSFPIQNAKDLTNAIRAVGRASNPAAAKAHIIQRAKALGLAKLLPDDWTSSKTREANVASRTGRGKLDVQDADQGGGSTDTQDMDNDDPVDTDDLGDDTGEQVDTTDAVENAEAANDQDCPVCDGSGKLGGVNCQRCDGSGKIASGFGTETSLPDSLGDAKPGLQETEVLHVLTSLREAPTKRGAAYEVVLIQEGRGNAQDGHFYTKQALKEAVANGVFDGIQAYADHPTKSEERDQPERSVRKLVGHYTDARYRETNGVGQVVAKFHPITGPGYEWVDSLLEAAVKAQENGGKRLIGISIDGGGKVEAGTLEDGSKVKYVREVEQVHSADLVTRPGAGGMVVRRLLESLRGSNPESQEDTMKLKPYELQQKVRSATAQLREAASIGDDADEAVRKAADEKAAKALKDLDSLSGAELLREATGGDERIREAEAKVADAERRAQAAEQKVETMQRTMLASKKVREASVPERLRERYVAEMVDGCEDEEAMTRFLEAKAEERKAIVEDVLGAVGERIEGVGARVSFRETTSDDGGVGYLESLGIPVLDGEAA
jgi:hypothetical protein